MFAKKNRNDNSLDKIIVWDLPTRIFHWCLVLLIIVSVVASEAEAYWMMDVHMYSGFSIMVLMIFRVLWGFFGGRHARFADFIRGPGTVLSYFQQLRQRIIPDYRGHNPAGGWSVVVLLLLISVQAVTGLYSNDDILTEGPLADTVSKAFSDQMTWIHHVNSNLLFVMVGLHVLVIVIHRLMGDNLVRAMIRGRKPDHGASPGNEKVPAEGNKFIAVLIVGAACGLVYYIVNL